MCCSFRIWLLLPQVGIIHHTDVAELGPPKNIWKIITVPNTKNKAQTIQKHSNTKYSFTTNGRNSVWKEAPNFTSAMEYRSSDYIEPDLDRVPPKLTGTCMELHHIEKQVKTIHNALNNPHMPHAWLYSHSVRLYSGRPEPAHVLLSASARTILCILKFTNAQNNRRKTW